MSTHPDRGRGLSSCGPIRIGYLRGSAVTQDLTSQLAARARGNHGGPRQVVDPDVSTSARALRDAGPPIPEVARKPLTSRGEIKGCHPSVTSLNRALADADDADRGER